ncbi:MAG: hypothetical protein HZB38_09790 [Planctomycetes bacterium]|nr:hypothetical protein [Planctomycetota bacterium]
MSVQEFDPQQLPIPDWGLTCPKCRYLLRGLPEHRCPECGAPLDMDELVRSWIRVRPPRFNGQERPLPNFGLRCRGCAHPLAGATTNACPKCGRGFSLDELRPRRGWFQIDSAAVRPLDMTTLAVVLEQQRVPFIPTGSMAAADLFLGTRAIGANLLVATEFYFELLWIVEDCRKRLEAIRSSVRGEWLCPTCGETNPGHFELCWNCESPMPAR